jgi:hypothetical protein
MESTRGSDLGSDEHGNKSESYKEAKRQQNSETARQLFIKTN